MSRASPRATRAATVAVAVAVAAVLAVGCATPGPTVGSRHAVRDPRAAASPSEAFGAPVAVVVVVVTGSGSGATRARHDVRGELIGCDDTRVYVRVNTTDRGAYVAYQWPLVQRMTVYRAGSAKPIILTTTLGVLSTISHGFFLIFSAPLWLLNGTATGTYAMRERAFDPADNDRVDTCTRLRPFARFPGGLPADLQAIYDQAP